MFLKTYLLIFINFEDFVLLIFEILEPQTEIFFRFEHCLYPIPVLARRGMKTIFLIKIPYFREFSAQYARKLLIFTTKK